MLTAFQLGMLAGACLADIIDGGLGRLAEDDASLEMLETQHRLGNPAAWCEGSNIGLFGLESSFFDD